MNQQEVWLRLSTVKRLDVRIACRVADIMTRGESHNPILLAESGMTAEQVNAFFQRDPQQLRASLRWLEHESHYLVPITDHRYPMMLKQIASAPLVLFVEGNLSALATPQLAMVGSRKYTEYGEQWASYFSAGLVRSGFTITSGLALGIDGICHEAALDSGGTTIAVLGSGLTRIHPRRHECLSEVEMSPSVPKLKCHF
ncbi:DNA-processing protein DprA, partial [Ewingella americana]